MPEIEVIYQKYKDDKAVFVSVDIMEPPDVVRNFVKTNGLSWDFVIDRTGDVARDYRINTIPANFFIDKDGNITAIHVGLLKRVEIEQNIIEAMK